MNDKDIYDWGREIGEGINKFVNSGEIKELQENIQATVENAMEEVRRSVQDAADYVGKAGQKAANKMESAWNTGTKDRAAGVRTYPQKEKRHLPVVKRPEGRVSGILMEVFGTFGAVIGWTASAMGILLERLSVKVAGMGIGTWMFAGFAGFAGICTVTALVGGMWRRRAGRFRKYVRTMGEQDFYQLDGLAQAVRRKEAFVRKDLREMIGRGWFLEGHLDEQETCFMLTDDAYRMYMDAQEQLRLRREEEERLAAQREMLERDPVQRQLRQTVEEGNEYIRRIRDINGAIAESRISGKLERLENICGRIFGHIGEKPEKLPDIRRFMSYYLPTTLKLLERYREFHEQPLQGENITVAKTEIEGMLDDINRAFEKMFDRLFEEEALDVSTDISVLSTMLAQEGLLEDGLRVKDPASNSTPAHCPQE